MNLAKSNSEPEPARMAVAVNDLNTQFKLLCLGQIGEHKEGTVLPIYGGNLKNPSAYVPGRVPPEWRVAVEDGDYESEVWFRPPPQLMDEVIFDEHPGQYEILVDNCRIIQMPVPEPETDTGCKVIQHPASFTTTHRLPRKAKKQVSKKEPVSRKLKPEPDPKQLFLFTDLNQTA